MKHTETYQLIGCAGKEAFESAALAKKIMKCMSRRHDKMKFKTYKCTHCHEWHIGNSNGDIKPKTKRVKLHFKDE